MANIDTPKSQGEYLGRAVRCIGNKLTIDTRATLANGDGLSFTDQQGQFSGARVNRALGGGTVLLREHVNIPRGTQVYRTADKAFNDLLAKPSATRSIAVDAVLRYSGGMLVLTLTDDYRFLEDQRVYKLKMHGYGKAWDNTVALLLDISNLEEAYVYIKAADVNVETTVDLGE